MPLSLETKTKALSEVKAYQAALWNKTTGNFADDEDIAKASELWLDSLIKLSIPDHGELLPDFTSIPDHDFLKAVIDNWMLHWKQNRYLHACIFGLTPETAKQFVDEILVM